MMRIGSIHILTRKQFEQRLDDVKRESLSHIGEQVEQAQSNQRTIDQAMIAKLLRENYDLKQEIHSLEIRLKI